MTARTTRDAAIAHWRAEEAATLTAIANHETYLRYVREQIERLRQEP